MNTTFPISASLFPAKVRHAVDEYWHGRVSQASRQQRRGVRDVGSLGFLRFCKSFFAHLAAHAED